MDVIEARSPGSTYFATGGKSGGFHQGIREGCVCYCLDEFSFDRMHPLTVLNLVSPGETRLNVKGSSCLLKCLQVLIVISNFDIDYFVNKKTFAAAWETCDPAAFKRRFTEINIGLPDEKILSSLKVGCKGGYAVEVLGRYFSTLVTDIVLGSTRRQREAKLDERREAVKNLTMTLLNRKTTQQKPLATYSEFTPLTSKPAVLTTTLSVRCCI
jgi:hypothetical protein